MLRRVVVGIAVVVALGMGASGAVSGDIHQPAVDAPGEFDTTVYEVTVHEDGSARWAIEHSRPLENETERERYRRFARDFTRNSSDAYENFVERTRPLLAAGRNATDRDMRATNFSREAYVTALGNRGILRMSFRWTAFAPVRSDVVVVADVFQGGLYVGPDQQFVVRAADGLAFDSVEPQPDRTAGATVESSDSVTWLGPQTFTDDHPRVVLVASESAAGTHAATSQDTDSPASPTTATDAQEDSMGMVMVGLLFLAIGIGGAAFWRATTSDDDDAYPKPVSPGDGGAATATEGAQDPVPEEELVSDSDRVLSMLEDNGGRMRQVDIVDGTEWSKSKVSMLLSDMEEDGLITKLRVGRENIISLKGNEPDAAQSPFEDEE